MDMNDNWERAKTCVEIGGLGTAVWLAFLTLGTLKEIEKQTGFAQGQLIASQKTLELTQGAVLAIGDPTTSGNRKQINLPINNVGALPVSSITVKCDYYISELDGVRIFSRSRIVNEPKMLILPRQPIVALVLDLPELSVELSNRLAAGRVTASVFGSIGYGNGFGGEQAAPFCLTYNSKTTNWIANQPRCGLATIVDLSK